MSLLNCGHTSRYTSKTTVCPICNFTDFVKAMEDNNPTILFEKENGIIPLIPKSPKYTRWASEIRVEYAKKLMESGKDYKIVNDNLDPEYWINNQVYFFGTEEEIAHHEKFTLEILQPK